MEAYYGTLLLWLLPFTLKCHVALRKTGKYPNSLHLDVLIDYTEDTALEVFYVSVYSRTTVGTSDEF